jgi:hypothetical protein
MKRLRNSFIIDTCYTIKSHSLKIHSLKVPWDKISNIIEPLHGLDPPTKDVKWNFDIEYSKMYMSLSDEIESLMEYLLTPYIFNINPNEDSDVGNVNNRSDGDEDIMSLIKNDNGLQTTIGEEYIYIETLKETSIILKLIFIRNTKLYSDWETISPLSGDSKTFSLRQCLFIQIAKIDILVWLFSKKATKKKQFCKKTESYEDFQGISEYGIVPKINYDCQTEFIDEKDSLWMKIASKPIFEQVHTNNHLPTITTTTPYIQPPTDSSNLTSRLNNLFMLHQAKNKNVDFVRFKSNDSKDTINDTANKLQKSEFGKMNSTLEKPKPILLYSQFDLEESFRLLLYRWKTINYHMEIVDYTKLLLLRSFFIIIFGGRSEKLGHDLSKSVFDANYTPGDYIYRMTIRFFYITEKIFKFECFRTLSRFSNLTFIPNFEQEHEIITKKLQSICLIWVKSESSKFYSDTIRKRHLELQVPPGDDDWLKYISPFEAIMVNNILEKLHSTAYGIISETANKSLEEIIVTKPIPISKLHDELVLIIVNLFFADYEQFSFKDEFVYDEMKEGKLINRQCKLDKPFLAVLFSKFLVHFQDSSNSPNDMQYVNVRKSVLLEIDPDNNMLCYNGLVLKAIVNDNTIYQAVATLLLLLNSKYPDMDNIRYMYQKISSHKLSD